MNPLPDGLLVSVRDADEAVEAVAGGAAIVDVKEPASGSLGRAAADVAAAIVRVVGADGCCTLAGGELADGPGVIAAHVEHVIRRGGDAAVPRGLKAGPAGLDIDAWRIAFAETARLLPAGVELIAVAYADWPVAHAPPPELLIDAAAACGATTLLVDTFDKSRPGLLETCDLATLASWVARAGAAGLRVALAGRLAAADLGRAAACGAGIIGVRSAACEGGRLGRVDRGKVARLVGTLSGVGPVRVAELPGDES